jgi:hypothetical protein
MALCHFSEKLDHEIDSPDSDQCTCKPLKPETIISDLAKISRRLEEVSSVLRSIPFFTESRFLKKLSFLRKNEK